MHRNRILQAAVLATLLSLTTAFAQEKEQSAAPVRAESYVIGSEDLLAVNVWKEPEISRVVVVRPDGKIALPLAGEFEAAGKTARQLELDITEKLQSLIQSPQVTVLVQEVKSQKFSIVGEVNRPGTYALDREMTVVEAVAVAGGLKDFANVKKMYILRRDEKGSTSRVRINYKDLLNGKSDETAMLKARDTVVVP